jgi:DNA-binding MarR family transcriptional regulator
MNLHVKLSEMLSQKLSENLSERKSLGRLPDMAEDVVDQIAAAWAHELPGVTGLELEIGKRAARLAALLNQAVEVELARLSLTKAEYEVLAVLRSAGPPYQLRPSDIAHRLVLSSGGTSNVLRRLAADELLERDPHPQDARGAWVRLSTRGIRVAEDAVRAASRAQADLLRDVSGEDQRAAADALRKVLLSLRDH